MRVILLSFFACILFLSLCSVSETVCVAQSINFNEQDTIPHSTEMFEQLARPLLEELIREKYKLGAEEKISDSLIVHYMYQYLMKNQNLTDEDVQKIIECLSTAKTHLNTETIADEIEVTIYNSTDFRIKIINPYKLLEIDESAQSQRVSKIAHTFKNILNENCSDSVNKFQKLHIFLAKGRKSEYAVVTENKVFVFDLDKLDD
jgi:hypothetical protein